MGRASIIEAYIQRLLEWNQPITPAILAAIAEEVGITQGELESIYLKVQAHLTRAHDYIELDYLENAIDELTQAQELDPINLDVLNTLARTYYLRYNRDSNVADRQQALRVAKRCVALNPKDKDAQTLLRSLEYASGFQEISTQTKPNIFILIGFLENIFSRKQFSRRTKTKIAVIILFLQQPISLPTTTQWMTALVVVTSSLSAMIGAGLMGGERLALFSNNEPQPVVSSSEFDPGPNIPVLFNHPGLLIEPRLSRLGNYKGEAYYKLHGVVINDSGQEVRTLNLKVELLNGDGDPISTINQVAITNSGATIRPGATQSFNLFHKISPSLISVRVSVTDIEQFELFSQGETPQ
ncbi:MAG: tetratricopeptide repeat protein [Leptolyngbyaceae cyanobacterium]